MLVDIKNEVELIIIDDEKVVKSKDVVVDKNTPKKPLGDIHEAKARKNK